MSGYAFGKVVNMGYAQAIEAIKAALAKEGFGVLTEIDVAATLKKKLNIDRAPYIILGACNPQFAAQAIDMEPQIGALLPCNVMVRVDEAERTVVEMMDPNAVLTLVDKPGIAAIATEVRTRLESALAAI